jgi:hypothetical protein
LLWGGDNPLMDRSRARWDLYVFSAFCAVLTGCMQASDKDAARGAPQIEAEILRGQLANAVAVPNRVPPPARTRAERPKTDLSNLRVLTPNMPTLAAPQRPSPPGDGAAGDKPDPNANRPSRLMMAKPQTQLGARPIPAGPTPEPTPASKR